MRAGIPLREDFIGAQHPTTEGELHRLAHQIGELVVCIEALYALIGPCVVEKRVCADPVNDLQRQARPEMVLKIMKRAKGQEASTEWDDGLARALYLRDCVTMGDWCAEIVEIECFRQLLEREPVRDERFRR